MLSLRNVSLGIAGRTLIHRLSLDIGPGEIVTLMGPSGTGKSSLLALIGGDLALGFVASGEIWLNGARVDGLNPERRRFGRLFQDDLLFPHMTVAENLLFAAAKGPPHERLAKVGAALKTAELGGFEDRAPHTLSGGQRARISLLRALLAQPAAILLDEPFNKLDQDLKRSIRSYTFSQIKAREIPALLVTHDRADAPEACRVLSISAEGTVINV